MNNEYKILKSYSKVWKIERTFYQIGGVNLPIPLAINAMMYFIMILTIMIALKNVIIIKIIPPIPRYILIPGGLAWFFSNKLLDGKNPIAFIRSIVIHYYRVFFKGPLVLRYRNMKVQNKRASYVTKISYRTLSKI